jgi:hypothetical protein
MFLSRPLNARKPDTSRPTHAKRRRPSLEALEGRQLMSLGSEFFSPINTTTRNAQAESDNASSANGTSVVVWKDAFSATDHDIRAQRLDAFGNKLGPEIVVSFSGLDEDSPAVAMDSRGDFVVTWRQIQNGGDTNVVARRFNSAGAPVGDVVQVGAGTFKEHDPDVAMDSAGNFVVAYVRDTNNNNPDVFAKRYNVNNQLLTVVSVATTPKAETHPSIAMAPDGRFDVAWEDAFSSTDRDIRLNRYGASGNLLGSNIISFSSSDDSSPSVAMDNSANAVVAWQRAGSGGGDIKARRVSASGFLGAEINIASTEANERNFSVALKRGGGGFVVAYDSSFLLVTSVKVAEVSASNAVTTRDSGVRFTPAVSINASDDYLLTYTAADGSDLNIRGRRGHLS